MNAELAVYSPCRRSPVGAAAVLALLALAGCSSLDISGDKIDYRSQSVKTAPLDVPPDLTQLSREGRYQPQAGVVVSANALKQTPVPAAGTTTAPVAARPALSPNAPSELRVERQGNARWLVTNLPPEQVYPLVRGFWLERGFVLTQDNPELGLLQTEWAENRAKLPTDAIRSTLGRIFEALYSTGERDLFRTRIERTATGSEVYVSHRGMEEVSVGLQKETTRWQNRPSDPQLEAEMLARLLARLGPRDEAVARIQVAQATEPAARARATSDGATALELDEGFDRAWRQVGLALDRGGFTVEDRDRAAGLYFVRYIDPQQAGQDEPGFFARLFSSSDANTSAKRVNRYRVVLKGSADKTLVTVQSGDGVADGGPVARGIVARLVEALR